MLACTVFYQDWDRAHLARVWNQTIAKDNWIMHYANFANDVLPGEPPLIVQVQIDAVTEMKGV